MKRQKVQRRERIYERILKDWKKYKSERTLNLSFKKKQLKKTQKTIYRSAAKIEMRCKALLFFQKDFGFFFHLRELRQQ